MIHIFNKMRMMEISMYFIEKLTFEMNYVHHTIDFEDSSLGSIDRLHAFIPFCFIIHLLVSVLKNLNEDRW